MTKREMLLQDVADRAFIVALSSATALKSEALAELSEALQALYIYDKGMRVKPERHADEAYRLGLTYLHDGGVYCGND